MKTPRGTTLIELLIACGLFLLSLVVIGQLTVRAMTSRSQTEDKNQVFRAATIILDQMQRDLEHAEAIYSPQTTFGETTQSIHPGNGDPILVLRTWGSKTEVVGYGYDRQAHELRRLLYSPGFDPADAATQILLSGESARQANAIDDFTLNVLNRSQSYGTLVVETQVQVATGTGPALRLNSKTRLRKL